MEEWKTVLGYPRYEISNYGNVRLSIGLKLHLKKKMHRSKYFQVCLVGDKKNYYVSVHTLVARHFIPNPMNKKTVHHINGNKLDNHIDNLMWCSEVENNLYSILNNNSHTAKWQKQLELSKKNFAKEIETDALVITNCEILHEI